MAGRLCLDEALTFKAKDLEITASRSEEDLEGVECEDDGTSDDEDEIQVVGQVSAQTKGQLVAMAHKSARPGEEVLVLLNNKDIDWQKATFVVNVIDFDEDGGDDMIEVRLPNSKEKILQKYQVASGFPPKERFMLGARVLFENSISSGSDFDEDEVTPRPNFCCGYVMEVPSVANKQRYLVFKETEDTACYFSPDNLRLVFGYPPTLSPSFLRAMKNYCRQGPERLLLGLKPGQTTYVRVQAVDKLKYIKAEVLEVDCSVALFRQVEAKKMEWIWRGSKRLKEVFDKYNQQRKEKENSVTSVGDLEESVETEKENSLEVVGGSKELPKKKTSEEVSGDQEEPPKNKEDYGEITEDQKPPNKKLKLEENPVGAEEKPDVKLVVPRQSGRKSTRAMPPQQLVAPEDVDESVLKAGIVVKRVLKTNLQPPLPEEQRKKHSCGTLCTVTAYLPDGRARKVRWIQYLTQTMQLGLLDWPIAFGIVRTIKRTPVAKRGMRKSTTRCTVEYVTPCARILRTMRDVHQYLLATSSILSVDMFSFEHEVQPMREFIANEHLATLGTVPIGDGEKLYLLAWKDDGELKFLKKNKMLDVTEGLEKLPIHWIQPADREEDTPQLVEFLTKVAPKGVDLNTKPKTFRSCCDCKDGCKDWKKCSCRILTNEIATRPTDDVRDIGCSYRRLRKKVVTGIFECNPDCACAKNPQQCVNRVAQNDPKVKMELYMDPDKGWAVRALQDIPGGTFVCSYAGELLAHGKADKDGMKYDDKYLLELDYISLNEEVKAGYEEYAVDPEEESSDSESSDEETAARKKKRGNKRKTAASSSKSKSKEPFSLTKALGDEFVVDSMRAGNVGRFFNHSCLPNLQVQNVFIDTHDPRFPTVAFFTCRVVKAGEELCSNYGYPVYDSMKEYEGNLRLMECRCGTEACQGTFVLSGAVKNDD